MNDGVSLLRRDGDPPPPHRVAIVGGGFGGLYTAKSLGDERVRITLVDRRNFHLFQPLLYQVATGWLSPSDIASPLRNVLSGRRNLEVLLGEVVAFDLPARRVRLADGAAIPYDTLVVAAGAETAYFGNEGWRDAAPGVKTLEDAAEIRHRLLVAFEAAEREDDPAACRSWLTIVVIGGGSTGVEMAGVTAELARDVLHDEFRRIDPRQARIILIHARDRILPEFPDRLAASARDDLRRLGVDVRTGWRVVDVNDDGVEARHDGIVERIDSRCVIWAAGVRASPLADRLARASGADLDGGGRIVVGPELTLPRHPEVFVIGDMAAVKTREEPLPGVAPVAMQQGRFVASEIRRRLDGEAQPRSFRYRDRGTLATIGRGAAVAKIGPFSFDGFLAWVVWLFVHILYLVEFQNRVIVVTRWAWDFFLHERGSRLITGAGRFARLVRPYPPAAGEPLIAPLTPSTPDERQSAPTAAPDAVTARRFGRVRVERRRDARPVEERRARR